MLKQKYRNAVIPANNNMLNIIYNDRHAKNKYADRQRKRAGSMSAGRKGMGGRVKNCNSGICYIRMLQLL